MKVKYPRTVHFPFSETITEDDKRLSDTSHFNGKEVVVTEKMDGENITIYNNGFHARSLDSKHKEYHSWLAQYCYTFNYNLSDDIRICGEYLYAQHSIKYNHLSSYFMGFSVWNKELCLSWDETQEWFDILGIISVPIVYRGIYSDEIVKMFAKSVIENGGEGVVVRLTSSFLYKDFSKSVAKYVRKNHVQTDKHWGLSGIEKNELA